MSQISIKMYSFTNNAWYFDNIFHNYVSKPLFNLGLYISYKLIDNQLLEFLGPTKAHSNFSNYSNSLSYYHIGKLSSYLLVFIIFVFFSLSKF